MALVLVSASRLCSRCSALHVVIFLNLPPCSDHLLPIPAFVLLLGGSLRFGSPGRKRGSM
jgi:hypothetical protein